MTAFGIGSSLPDLRSRGRPDMAPEIARMGLSPWARGNPGGKRRPPVRAGPIPVGTGEPFTHHRNDPESRAYPRGHGGTQEENGGPPSVLGLSPWARGNPFTDAGWNGGTGRYQSGLRRPACASQRGSHGAGDPRGATALASWNLQPIAELIAEQATAKLGGRVTIDVVQPLQANDVGGEARALSAVIGALAQAKEAGIEGATLQDALAFIDWADE